MLTTIDRQENVSKTAVRKYYTLTPGTEMTDRQCHACRYQREWKMYNCFRRNCPTIRSIKPYEPTTHSQALTEETQGHAHPDWYVDFTSALYVTAQIWKQLKYPSKGQQINKLVYPHNSYYSTTGRATRTHAPWATLTHNKMLSRRSQTQASVLHDDI